MGLKRIHLDQIEANPDQPRKVFDDAALRELASSILARGLKQPITVRPIGGDTYQVVMGERRWRAHCLLRDEDKLEEATILAFVRRTTDEDVAVDAIVENLTRADLTVLEEANAFQHLLDAGYSVARIAREIGIQPWRVKYRLQLTALDPIIQEMLAKGQITSPMAHELGKLPNHGDQRRLVGLVAKGSLRNETQVRVAVEAIKKGEGQPALVDLPPEPTPRSSPRSAQWKPASTECSLRSLVAGGMASASSPSRSRRRRRREAGGTAADHQEDGGRAASSGRDRHVGSAEGRLREERSCPSQLSSPAPGTLSCRPLTCSRRRRRATRGLGFRVAHRAGRPAFGCTGSSSPARAR
jgi:ParB family transcriptional regulator, chromosome partitioning protein